MTKWAMRVPSAAELLDVWEVGTNLPLARRALLLLAAACPDTGEEDLATLPIGRRDARLLQLRERLFGTQLTVVTPCRGCGEQVESSFHVADIRLGTDQPAAAMHNLCVDGYRLAFRLPATGDLVALAAFSDVHSARDALLARCLVEAHDAEGQAVAAESLPSTVAAAVAAQMAAADPQADVQLDFACPACAHRWRAMFDIAAILWSELHVWARRTLREVDALARAYGWREADVLALSPTRRQIYLELSR